MANAARRPAGPNRVASPPAPVVPRLRPLGQGAAIAMIGHAGLAVQRLHGTPDRRHLEWAAGLGLDRLELDVCHTADPVMVVRHDQRLEPGNVRLPRLLVTSAPTQGPASARGRRGATPTIPAGTPVAALPLSTLRRLDPGLLTLDEAVEVIAGRVPLLLDLKGTVPASLIGRWLRGWRDAAGVAVCTPSIAALRELRVSAGRAERWPTIPEFGKRRRDRVAGALSTLWVTHRDPARVRHSLAELGHAIGEIQHSPQHAVAAVASLPWRWHLPELAARWAREVRASGLCVPHWLLTAELCDTAHRLGLPLTAFTVNEDWAVRRVVELGATTLTTDEVERVRRLLRRWETEGASGRAGDLVA